MFSQTYHVARCICRKYSKSAFKSISRPDSLFALLDQKVIKITTQCLVFFFWVDISGTTVCVINSGYSELRIRVDIFCGIHRSPHAFIIYEFLSPLTEQHPVHVTKTIILWIRIEKTICDSGITSAGTLKWHDGTARFR